jgi:hypothetical protein
MFVRLGSAYQPHRAHVVRGVLEAHGIPAVIWHEAALHLYSPGWEPCSIMIPEGEAEAALEVMNARPEEPPPQEGAAEMVAPFQKYPAFLDWAFTVAVVLLLIGVASVAGMVMEEIFEGRRIGVYQDPGTVNPLDLLRYLVIVVPLGALAGAALLKLCMAPLVIWKGSRWMGMLAYLWVQWILFVVVPVAIATNFELRRFADG